MTIIDITSGSESSWIDSTYPDLTSEEVDRTADFIVVFAKSVAAAALISTNFVLMTPTGEEFTDAFRQIDLGRDYNSISRRLTLHLSRELDPEAEYAFIIRDLFDPSGLEQDQQHVVTFTTNGYAGSLDTEVENENLLQIIDHTMSGIPGQVAQNADTGVARVVRSVPTAGSYNLAALHGAGLITLSFSANVVDPSVTIERRLISLMETSWETLAADATVDPADPKKVLVQMPLSATGDYYDAGYEYRVTVNPDTTVSVSGSTVDFGATWVMRLTGSLDPMFASVKDVLWYLGNVEPIDAAIEIYLNSQYALSLDTSIVPTAPPRAASDYALYGTLASLTSDQVTADQVVLGDFQVKHSSGQSLSDKFKNLASNALSRIMRVGPRVVIKGGSEVTPFATRSW